MYTSTELKYSTQAEIDLLILNYHHFTLKLVRRDTKKNLLVDFLYNSYFPYFFFFSPRLKPRWVQRTQTTECCILSPNGRACRYNNAFKMDDIFY